MHFQINRNERNVGLVGEPERALVSFTWRLINANDETIVKGPRPFATEKDARAQIAQAKRTMAGASRYKVKSPEASVPLQNPPSGE